MTSPIYAAVEQYPRRLAFTDGQIHVTYVELSEQIEEFSRNHLAGLSPGEHVAWCPRNDLEALVTFWALQHRGLVACPISFRIPAERRSEILGELNAKWLPELSSDRRGECLDQPSRIQPEYRKTDSASTSPATIILSSGSTDAPKQLCIRWPRM